MAVWQSMFCLAVLALLCRAAIPVGYMPDASHPSDRIFAITLCNPAGQSTITMDFSPDQPDEPDTIADPCPYALIVDHQLMTGPALATLAVNAPRPSIFISADHRALPPLPAVGPPLGPRAPPSFMV